MFECCDVYARIYINKSKTAYVGWCPRCTHRVEIKINPSGTASRFFKVKHWQRPRLCIQGHSIVPEKYFYINNR